MQSFGEIKRATAALMELQVWNYTAIDKGSQNTEFPEANIFSSKVLERKSISKFRISRNNSINLL